METKTMTEVPVLNLTLDPFGEEKKEELVAINAQDEAEKIKELAEMTASNLTPEEMKMVDDLAEKIDITNSALVLQYGAGTQQKIADFSDSALQNVRTQDLGQVGDEIAKLVGELKSFNEEADSKGFLSIFKKAHKNVTVLKAKYDKAEVSVNNIVTVLDGHQTTLLKDIAVLDQLYERNLIYFKELSAYILAGKKRLEQERTTTLPELKRIAEETGLPEDAQKANDFASMCERFEKKIYDLELTRMVSIQMAPQIRLVQGNDTVMSEKIQSTIVNTIPLWKSQMVIALGLAHSQAALEAERKVTDMTNELLKKNAELLHQGTVEIAKESERGIIDIETLKHTNQELISTLDEVQQIQADGREKRRTAEAELGRIETEIKNKLLEIRQ